MKLVAVGLLTLTLSATSSYAAVLTVTGTGDAIAVDGAVTLREAITAANTNASSGDSPAGDPGLDTIAFNIPGAGVQLINVSSPLPPLIEPATIDGATQPGFTGTNLITLDGTGAGAGAVGLTISLTASGSTIRSIVIRNFPADGIVVSGDDNVVGAAASGGPGGNTIIFNGASTPNAGGVRVLSGVRNRISTNSISNNGGFPTIEGIDLGVDGRTANDPCDPDIGANQLQNYPLLSRAIVSGGTTTVFGTFNSQPSTQYAVEFYWNHPASFEQAGVFLGSESMTTDAACNASFAVTFPFAVPTFVPFHVVTAIAIDPLNNTSEISPQTGPRARLALDVTKSFTPAQIMRNDTSQLSITIGDMDTSAGDSNLSFTDTYPAGLVNATVPAASSTCGGIVTAVPGDGSFTFSGGNTASSTCTVTVNVTSASVGSYVNTLPAQSVTTMQTMNLVDVSATLDVTELTAPGVAKAFNPTSVTPGETSTLTITLTNPNSEAISGVAFTDNYPAGLANAATPNGATTCGGIVTATPGGSSLALTGGTIPPNSSCTVSAEVTLTSTNSVTNTLPAGSVTSTNAAPGGAAAAATLNAAATTPIPTLSTWFLGLCAMLMGISAILKIR
jgi:uncharacterized repeat protein (TIGR01451 family)